VDKTAGLVRPISIHQPNANGTVKKTFPVSCNLDSKTSYDKYKDLIPDDKYKSIMYFEDLGVNVVGSDARYINCQSTLRLVCWLNGKRLGYDGCGISTIAVIEILKVFTELFNPFNEGKFTKIKIAAVSEQAKEPTIFTKYSYDEAQTQFLMQPFDYFALQIRVDYSIALSCVTEFELLEPSC
jgi:hypothetical protein